MVDKREKIIRILNIVQSSLKQDYESKRLFIDSPIFEDKTKKRKLNKI